jgi:N-acetylglucosaminyl-diphospho-decaprenol L-rhamnosyltransferase
MKVGTATATAVFVAYATPELDLSWIPASVPVVVVHNDRSLELPSTAHPLVREVFSDVNLGFGAAVNVALEAVTAERVVVCNPDVAFRPEHWEALAGAAPAEVGTVPLVDGKGQATWVVNPYPTPASLLLTGYRVGRFLRRWPALRRRAGARLGTWGQEHAQLRSVDGGSWPLASHWVSGAAFSVDTERLRAVGGFDDRYFLYLEDVDLCARMADRFPDMRATVAPVTPAVHAVGGSARDSRSRRVVDRHYLASCRQYAGRRRGLAWRACSVLLLPRGLWLSVAR